LFSLNVDNRVEEDKCGQRIIGQLQSQHVTLRKRYIRIQLTGDSYHLWRQINAAHVDAEILEITGDLAGAATQLANNTGGAYFFGKLVEQLTIKRLAGEFFEKLGRILFSYTVVAGLDVGI